MASKRPASLSDDGVAPRATRARLATGKEDGPLAKGGAPARLATAARNARHPPAGPAQKTKPNKDRKAGRRTIAARRTARA